jgi:hypothetical protein
MSLANLQMESIIETMVLKFEFIFNIMIRRGGTKIP